MPPALLKVVAGRLASVPGATVGRLGGEEFMVVLHQAQGAEGARSRLEALRAQLCQPTLLGDESVPVLASLGWSLFPRDGQTAGVLLAAADDALYAHKRGRAPGGDPGGTAPGPSDRRRNRQG